MNPMKCDRCGKTAEYALVEYCARPGEFICIDCALELELET